MVFRKFNKIIFSIMFVLSLSSCGVGDEPFSKESRVPKGYPQCTGVGITIYGNVYYEDRLYGRYGFNGARPAGTAKYVDLEVIRDVEEPTVADIIGFGATDGEGKFCISFINPGRSEGVRVKVYASTLSIPEGVEDELLGMRISVHDLRGGNLYSFTSDHIDDTRSDIVGVNLLAEAFILNDNTGVRDQQGLGGVFNILDNMATAYKTVYRLSGENFDKFNDLEIFWQSEERHAIKTGTYGSFYLRGETVDRISINGGNAYDSGDHDEYDDDIILHEFGHYAVFNLWNDDSPGGQHFLDFSNQDMRLSWSEGWATFFSCAMRNNPLVVDTLGGDVTLDGTGGGANFSYSVEDYFMKHQDDRFLGGKYISSEVTVSGLLWDIFDTFSESYDSISSELGLITSSQEYFKDENGVKKRGITFDTFWEGLNETNSEYVLENGAGLVEILKNSDVEYFEDRYEVDNVYNSERTALVDVGEHHSLYPKKDIDFIGVDLEKGINYILRTYNLTNGADTTISLYEIVNGELQLISGNDNNNGLNYASCSRKCPKNGRYYTPGSKLYADNPGPESGWIFGDGPLSSKIFFTPKYSGRYVIEVQSSKFRPISAGIYGSYDFAALKDFRIDFNTLN